MNQSADIRNVDENHYGYAISLRITHPSLDPSEITGALHLDPDRTWKVGDPRATTKGAPLKGVYSETFWTKTFVEGEYLDKELEAAVGEIVDQLVPHRPFFQRIRSEDGKAEFFVGWFFNRQSGGTFDCDLMTRMADLKIDLSFDVYPP
jgi:Domain of unknown function (DUF4279)